MREPLLPDPDDADGARNSPTPDGAQPAHAARDSADLHAAAGAPPAGHEHPDPFETRLERLQQVAIGLAAARTPEAVAQVMLGIGRQAAEAPMGTIGLLVDDGRAFELLAAAGYDEAPLARWRRFANEPGLPIADVVLGRQPVLVPDLDALMARYPRAAAWSAMTGYCAAAVYPMVAGEGDQARVLGFVGFDFDRPQRFTPSRRAVFELLVRMGAQSMDRALAHQAEQRARHATETANRAKDEFLATLSHELRTPLNAILGWAHLLRTGRLGAAQTRQALESIERNARAQSAMVEELLDATRLAAGDIRLALRPLDLGEAVRAACDASREAAEDKGVRLDCGTLGPLPPVWADRQRIEQVLRQLLGNAIKFTPGGGRVRVEASPAAGQVELSVHDTGQGIEPAFLPHLFEPFRQADGSITRQHGGLGLGLTIVRQLVELHGGSVQARASGPDGGATFVVALPTEPPGLAAPFAVGSQDHEGST